jgi:signal transduction histidine kinase
MTQPLFRSATELRQRAEEWLEASPVDQPLPRVEGDLMRLVHELQVHQVELEMQNQVLLDAQAEISRNLEQLTDLYELAPIAYFTVKRDGRIAKSNAMGRKLLGNPVLALDRCHLARFVASEALPIYREFFARIFAKRRLETCNLTLRSAEGTPPVYVFMEGVADESGQECRLVASDLTRQHALEEALSALAKRTDELAAAKEAAEAASHAKASFLANMSHEIRTPMNAILGMAHLMRRSGLSVDQEAKLDKMDTAARHLLGIVNDILDLSKIEAEQVRLDETGFSLDELLADVSMFVGEKITAKQLVLHIALEPALETSDPEPAEQCDQVHHPRQHLSKGSDRGQKQRRTAAPHRGAGYRLRNSSHGPGAHFLAV